MKVKLFEIRDSHTFIAAMAVQLDASGTEEETWLLNRVGFGGEMLFDGKCVIFARLDGGRSNYDPHSWGDRTMMEAHLHIERNWPILKSGDVIDVQFLLGETAEPKKSERILGAIAECAR